MNSFTKVIDNIIPISLFNRGQASKIFADVKKSGTKIVVKNNMPECILMSPQEYKNLFECLEDEHDYEIAMERMRDLDESKLIPWEKIMEEEGLTQKELDAMPDVELE